MIDASYNNDNRGFTLTELLVAMVIVAILATVIISGLGAVREIAERTKCASNIRQVSAALLMYANGNGGNMPSVIGNVTGSGAGRTWARALLDEELIPKSEIFACPLDTASIQISAANGLIPCSYAMAIPVLAPGMILSAPRNIHTIDNPAIAYMLLEWPGRYASDAPNGAWWKHVDEHKYAAQDLIADNQRVIVSTRHPHGARHFSFMDGHVQYLSKEESQRAVGTSAWTGLRVEKSK